MQVAKGKNRKIYNKIASGQELTASEEDAIRQKDPKAYMEYKAAKNGTRSL